MDTCEPIRNYYLPWSCCNIIQFCFVILNNRLLITVIFSLAVKLMMKIEYSCLLVCVQSAEVTRKLLRDRHNKKNPTQPIPVFPNWVYDRPALIGDFITSSAPMGDPVVAVGRYRDLIKVSVEKDPR